MPEFAIAQYAYTARVSSTWGIRGFRRRRLFQLSKLLYTVFRAASFIRMIRFTSDEPYPKCFGPIFAPVLPRTEVYCPDIVPRCWLYDSNAPDSLLASCVRRLFFGVSMETDGCVIKLLDTFFRSCAHDSCRWYQDYRNERRKKIRSTKKQLLGLAVFCPRWVCFPNIILSEQQRSQFPTRRAIILPVSFCVERLLYFVPAESTFRHRIHGRTSVRYPLRPAT